MIGERLLRKLRKIGDSNIWLIRKLRRKHRSSVSLDFLNSDFAKKIQKETADRMKEQLQFEEACQNGFYCIKCHAPFENIGIAFLCDCPPSETIRSPIVFTQDLDPDIQKAVDKKFLDLLDN